MSNLPASRPARIGAERADAAQELAATSVLLATQQLGDFARRLKDALLNLSEQSVRPVEAELSFNAFNHLRINFPAFEQAAAERLSVLLAQHIRALETSAEQSTLEDEALSLVTFEEMENKVLLDNVAQALELDIADALSALNLRLAVLLGREQVETRENPFRPQTFVQAVFQGWCSIDPAPESYPVVLRLLGPELFLPLATTLGALNAALVERKILPDLTDAYRLKKSQNTVGSSAGKGVTGDKKRYNKVRDLLLSGKKTGDAAQDDEDLNIPDLFAPGNEGQGWGAATISVKVGPRLFAHLTKLQNQLGRPDPGGSADAPPATMLRQVPEHLPAGSLTQIDENTIELLAKIFDYLLQDQKIPTELRRLIGQLQIPLLKAALIDKKFFVKDDHPARQLVDKLAKSSLLWDQKKGQDDPLYKMIEQIVARVQKDFDQQMGLFADVASNLDAFLETEEAVSRAAIAEPIAEALRQEKLRLAQDAAQRDIALRIESGEVAGFVEVFLESQWTRILVLAHSVREHKPDVLIKAHKAMDDLIWSIKPKTSPEQRKDLVTRLPSILAMLNAWLNAIKWDAPERVRFFSNLAERHAVLVRLQPELSSRHHVEIAVNAAQKASNRRMGKKAKDTPEEIRDRHSTLVDDLEPGQWIEFSRSNGMAARFRLVWVSPQRSRFIFADRLGQSPFTFTATELAQTLRSGKAGIALMESVMDRALAAALEDN